MKTCVSIFLAMIAVSIVLFSPVDASASGLAEAVFYVK
jgi:hypothetical protein